MSELTSKTKDVRVAQILRIINMASQNDLTIRDACEVEGISISTFQRWYDARKDEIIRIMEALAMVRVQEITQLAQIKQDGIRVLGSRVHTAETRDVIAILRYVEASLEVALTASGSYDEEQEKAAQRYQEALAGPHLIEAENRFTVHHGNKAPIEEDLLDQEAIEGDYTDIVE